MVELFDSMAHYNTSSLVTGAMGYYETSALTQNNVNTTIMAAIRAAIGEKNSSSSRRSRWLNWPWKKRYVYFKLYMLELISNLITA